MINLAKKSDNIIKIGEREIKLNSNFRSCLFIWQETEKIKHDKEYALTVCVMAYELLLGIELEDNFDIDEVQDVMAQIFKYLDKHARMSDVEDDVNSPNLIDFDLDENMIRDAFRLQGIDLYSDDLDYPAFMSAFRNMQTTKAAYCRVLYLRSQHKRGKLTKEEKQEITRSWGWSLIKIINKQKQKELQDDEEFYKQAINQLRAKDGLPPL